MKKVKLLSPARNMKAVKAAVKNSDEIYFGLRGFNMRERAENFGLEDLANVVKYCHDRGVKAIIATNILIYNRELDGVRLLLESAASVDIDAVIVNDLAVLEMAKEIGIPFHISTQCNVSNSLSAKFYERLGADRIIMARECSLDMIKEIKRNLKKTKVEAFVHGAMCTAISGRCYFSAVICGTEEKSANRGMCIQPCRRSWKVIDEENNEFIYDGVRFLNSRDLCMVGYVPEMIEAGIDCFKIEGRMRDPHYVDVVSSVYRAAIESYYNGTFNKKQVSKWITELRKVFNRGFTTGFYFKRPTEKDHQHVSPRNLSHYRLIKVGIIKEYDENTKIATVDIINGKLRKGMEVIIMGDKTDTYFKQKIWWIKIDNEKVAITPVGSLNKKIEVQVKLIEKVEGMSKDYIYAFTDRTYINRYKLRKKGQKIKKSDFYRLR
ncbi:MAG: peptidase U32 family protein [Candidatus Helarchaeota archaeon]